MMASCTGVARVLAVVVLVTAQMVVGRNKAADSATEKSNDNEQLRELLGTLENYQDTDSDGLYKDYFDNYPEPELVKQGQFKSVANWPKHPLNVGQVVGLAVDGSGRPVLFHRAGREWEANSFDDNTNKFQKKGDGAIKDPTVSILNQTDGRLLKAWGENMFYLPHGLAIDSEGNYWMTDVALHQVLKFEGVATEPSMTLGKAFEPATSNDDKTRFCKPTDVAVASSGEVFVSDGYCNSRIVKFDKDGKYLGQMGDGEFNIPHGIALAEDHDILCVADRENLRVLCLNAGLKHPERFGEFDRVYSSEVVGSIYGIAYSPKDHLLYGVNGPTTEGRPRVITIDLTASEHSSAVAVLWPDQEGFFSPHDIAVSPDGNNVYVGEIEPHRVWKFDVERP